MVEAEHSRLLRDLPSPETRRWVPRRKAAVVAAVRGGALDITEACRRYSLSVEEFLAWERALSDHGVAGLRSTRAQIYREPTQKDLAQKDSAQKDSAQKDSAQKDSAQKDSAQKDSAQKDSAQKDSARKHSAQSEPAEPDPEPAEADPAQARKSPAHEKADQ